MSKRAEKPAAWWAKYSGPRVVAFMMAVAAIGGVLDAFLQHRFPFLYSFLLLRMLLRGLGFSLPVIFFFTLRAIGRDGWLLRPDSARRLHDERTENI